MNSSLTEFKDHYLESIIRFLWRQWSALGVAGAAESNDNWIIDPEALLIFTCTMGRHEARLFDEVVDWLHTNGNFVNVQRLKRILKTESFQGAPVLSAISATLNQGEHALKWKSLAQQKEPLENLTPLFYLKSGKTMPSWGDRDETFAGYGFERKPMQLRGYSQPFRPTQPTTLLLQLRALFGINARSEVIAYLLTHDAAHPSLVARETYYYQKTVQNTLVDMALSGAVRIKTSGREKNYWLNPEPWRQLLDRNQRIPQWITWPPLFSALEQVWLKLNEEKLRDRNDLYVSSELRQLMVHIRPLIERAGFDSAITDDRHYLGEEYLNVFLSDLNRALGDKDAQIS